MEKTSIRVSSVGIEFFLRPGSEMGHGQGKSLKSWLARRRKSEFWALKDISFETHSGEIFGIVGSNGSGKSTLLKVIAGIYPATEGDVRVNGKIAPLIELGAAFNPELTGAENIYLTGSIYRIPRRVIRDSFAKIVDFSGLRKFINIPVKNYSSGMFIRLAFSIIIFFQPDIVLIDEVFSVGDKAFQQKSFEKILSFRRQGATILLVTHDTKLITQICDRALILSQGKMSFLGPAEEAVAHYHQIIKGGEGLEADSRISQPPPPAEAKRWGTKLVEIKSVSFVDEQGRPQGNFNSGDYFEARIDYVSRLEDPAPPIFGIAISTIFRLLIYGPNTLEADFPQEIPSEGVVRFIIPRLPLLEGDYLFSAAVYDGSLQTAFDHHEMMYHFRVMPSGGRDFGSVRIESKWGIDRA
jgi:ABC-type polysaccharide/polyol phosphate transport system ATPase subunit